MNNNVWALAVLLLAAGVLGRPQGDEAGEDAVEEVEEVKAPEVVEVAAEEMEQEEMEEAVDATEEMEEMEDEMIKEENKAKCGKCLSPIFRSNHDNFCIKCVKEGVIDTSEQEKIETALKCKKCKSKAKFRARHQDFCAHTCVGMKSTTTTEAPEYEEYEEDYEYEYEEKPKKKKQNKKKKKTKKKDKNKAAFATTFQTSFEPADETSAEVADAVEDEAEGDEEIPDIEKFGFFGTILKNIIFHNTWIDTPVEA